MSQNRHAEDLNTKYVHRAKQPHPALEKNASDNQRTNRTERWPIFINNENYRENCIKNHKYNEKTYL